jgi:hypothetical protein
MRDHEWLQSRLLGHRHFCCARVSIDGPRELGLVAGEFGPQGGDRDGAILRRL